MAKSWQYGRWRSVAMQGAMWVVLGATVGLAALVSHEKRQAQRADLGPPQQVGGVWLRLPEGWQSSVEASDDQTLKVVVSEPGGSLYRRTLLIELERSSLSFLDLLMGRFPAGGKPLRFGPVEGRTSVHRYVEQGVKIAVIEGQASLPTRQVLRMRLWVVGVRDEARLQANVDLFERLAASLSFDPPTPGN